MKKLIPYLCTVTLLFTMCSKQIDDAGNSNFSLLNGNKYIIEVDRILNLQNIHFPNDKLEEDDYFKIYEPIHYNIEFSKDGKAISIEPGSLKGELKNNSEKSITFELIKGVFAGGRFTIWKNSEFFEFENTIFGSGVPIIKSERGKLDLTTN